MALLLAAMTAAKWASGRSSSWHKYHLYETFERLLYIKVSIEQIDRDTQRVRFEWNVSPTSAENVSHEIYSALEVYSTLEGYIWGFGMTLLVSAKSSIGILLYP
jgi:hypothetical protein